MNVLFLTATQNEMNTLCSYEKEEKTFFPSRHDIRLFHNVTGVGACDVDHKLILPSCGGYPDVVISFGCVGSISTSILSGSFIFPTAVSFLDNQELYEINLSSNKPLFLPWIYEVTSCKPFFGKITTVHSFVFQQEHKTFLHCSLGALAVDMESFFIVKACANSFIPIVLIRLVVDDYSDNFCALEEYLSKENSILSHSSYTLCTILDNVLSNLKIKPSK